MEQLTGRTAVITGAASGIGLAMAHRFGAAGMNLVLADVETGPLDDAEAALTDAGDEVSKHIVDVRDHAQLVDLEAAARDRFGHVHLLCNNAGVGSGGPVADPDDIEMWRWTIDVNLWGVIYGCKVFLHGMIEHGEGAHVVNTASMAGHASAPMMGPYNISKYGVVALSETLAKEMAMAGSEVGVSVLCPAFVATKIATSRRNLPDDLRSDEPDAAGFAGGNEDAPTQTMMENLVASGIPTETVAEAVHDAVVNDEFWILTHPETKPVITERARQIVEGVNPVHHGMI